jgi:transcriptional regulator EpsA
MQNNELLGRRESTPTVKEIMQKATAIQQLPTSAGRDTPAPRDDVSVLGVSDLEKLQLILYRALRVHARSHFFVWTQGILQALLPHDILVCALAGAQAQGFTIDVLSSALVNSDTAEYLRAPSGGFVEQLARNWRHAGRHPVVYHRNLATSGIDAQFDAHLVGATFDNFAAHGMCGVDGAINSLFILINQPDTIGARQLYLFEILMPILHATWLRVHLGQPRAVQPSNTAREASVLTAREVEIIRWVHDGKRNSQIGVLLKISPLTVKSHVQKILRKLNVQNRTQAVAKSLALKILDPSRHA